MTKDVISDNNSWGHLAPNSNSKSSDNSLVLSKFYERTDEF